MHKHIENVFMDSNMPEQAKDISQRIWDITRVHQPSVPKWQDVPPAMRSVITMTSMAFASVFAEMKKQGEAPAPTQPEPMPAGTRNPNRDF